MRWLAMLLLIPVLVANRADSTTPALTDFEADIHVTVTRDGEPLEGAVVKLDVDNNGIWEEHEPQAVTGVNGVADFGTIVSIEDPGHGGDDPADIIDWHPSRILTGNLRGAVGAREVQFDFVLPAGVGTASLGLYDLRGRRLAGTDGVGDLALDVPGGLSSGVYFVRLSAEPAAPVTHRITSVGQRAQTVRARQVSAAEAVAAGWVESRTQKGAQKSRDEGHPITIMVSHGEHSGMSQEETVTPGQNMFTVAMPVSEGRFVYIPPGTFTMGSPEDEPGRNPNEGRENLHQVTLTKGFYISKYEVTEAWWHQVMGGTVTNPQLPKNNVSWDLAVQFCNALSLQEGLTPAYTIHGPEGDVTWHQDADGYRLPTEAEWEYACRAGSTTAFANGALTGGISCEPLDPNLDAMGWYCGNRTEGEGPAVVGQKQANAWGLYDMHGNLYEWVWCGWYREYTGDVEDPVHNAEPGAYRVNRGGWWTGFARNCRSAFRGSGLPDYWGQFSGFRPVRTDLESP